MVSILSVARHLPLQVGSSARRGLADRSINLLGCFPADTTFWRRRRVPTVELARETAAQLRAGLGVNVDVIDGYLALPGIEDRSRTFFMENWMAPIRAWYNEDQSSFDYVQLPNKNTDAVVEVGISNYEMLRGGIVIQVMSKLVDPTNKRVLGRSRNHVIEKIPPIKVLFGNEGQNYKEFFAQVTRDLIAANLKELGLLP